MKYPLYNKRKRHSIYALIMVSMLSSCVFLFSPRKQKICITTPNEQSQIFIDGKQVGEGKRILLKTKKTGAKQVIVKVPGHKDKYAVILPKKKIGGFIPFYTIDLISMYGALIDMILASDAQNRYPDLIELEIGRKHKIREEDEKYINLEAIGLDINNIERDFQEYNITTSKNLLQKIEDEEKNREEELRKKQRTLSKEGFTPKPLVADDTKFSEITLENLKSGGYIDTINKVFNDANNTLTVKGFIKRGGVYYIWGKGSSRYTFAKINILWNIKNAYDEVLDSVNIWGTSDEYANNYQGPNSPDKTPYERLFQDAVENSFQNLLSHPAISLLSRIDTNITSDGPPIMLTKPVKQVTSPEDASEATVIIKRKDGGHGSGFAITNDGYILTNYHVISGKTANNTEEITIILPNKEEVSASIIRINKAKDIVLLKTEHTFQRAFYLDNQKLFKKYMSVYAIGAPKSVELENSVTLGTISNERNSNNNLLIQLNININSGNSGGPVFDNKGVLHGIIRSKLFGHSTEGVGFAIPAYAVHDYLNLKYQ